MGRPSWSESNVWQISAHFMHSDTVIMSILFVEFLAQSGHPQPFCVFSLNFAILSVSETLFYVLLNWVCQFVQRMIESWRRRAVPTVREKCPSNSILISVEFISALLVICLDLFSLGSFIWKFDTQCVLHTSYCQVRSARHDQWFLDSAYLANQTCFSLKGLSINQVSFICSLLSSLQVW